MRPHRSGKAYTDAHARSGVCSPLPAIETWENQFPPARRSLGEGGGYEITIEHPEFTSVCPKTRLPDFGTITVVYAPRRKCLELKSFKEYLLAYRDLGIFYENVVNRILRDVVKACDPVRATVKGEFNARGGMRATVVAIKK